MANKALDLAVRAGQLLRAAPRVGGSASATESTPRVGGSASATESTPRGRRQTVSVVEATSAGLVSSALQSVPGASRFYIGSANVYSGRSAIALLPQTVVVASGMMDRSNYAGAETYVASKRRFVRESACGMRESFDSTWCLAESGTCGPDFYVPEVTEGFTAVGCAGPNGFYRERVVRTGHGERRRNMEAFAEAALQLLVDCLEAQVQGHGVTRMATNAVCVDHGARIGSRGRHDSTCDRYASQGKLRSKL